jgi:hypothetical protein
LADPSTEVGCTSDRYIALFQRLPNLQSLDLSGHKAVDGHVLTEICTRLTELHTLDISRTSVGDSDLGVIGMRSGLRLCRLWGLSLLRTTLGSLQTHLPHTEFIASQAYLRDD